MVGMYTCFTRGFPTRRGSCPSSPLVVPPRTCAPPGLISTGSLPPRVPPTKSPISRVKDDERGSPGGARSERGVPLPRPLPSGDSQAILAYPKSSSSSCTLFGQSGTSSSLVGWPESGQAAVKEWYVCSDWEGVPVSAWPSLLSAVVLASREVYGELSSYQTFLTSLEPSSASCMPSM